jgi:hypothetical protein
MGICLVMGRCLGGDCEVVALGVGCGLDVSGEDWGVGSSREVSSPISIPSDDTTHT